MTGAAPDLLRLVAGLAAPDARPEAAARLAAHLGGRELIVFVRDAEVGLLLPAPGFRRTLPGWARWRPALAAAERSGRWRGALPVAGGSELPTTLAYSADADAALAILDGPDEVSQLDTLLLLLPLLSGLLRGEHATLTAAGQARAAAEAAAQASSLTAALDGARSRLQGALHAAETARRQAELADHAKADFMAVMSHELRTPLNAIGGYAELLLAGIPEPIPPSAAQKVERIGVGARHLLELIDEILTFSRLEAGEERLEVEAVHIAELLREVTALVEPLALRKNIRFDCHMPDPPGTMEGDARKIRQILVNLLANGIKFTSDGCVGVRMARGAGEILFTVTDTGIGIAPEHVNQIFDPFWQARSGTTRTAGGTGLGLSVTRKLARLMGGDVSVRSQPGRGSEFVVRLPVKPPAAPR